MNVRRLGTKCKEAEEELEIEVCLQNMETISAASNYYDSRWYLLIGAQAGNKVISTITRSDSLLVASCGKFKYVFSVSPNLCRQPLSVCLIHTSIAG